MKDYQTSLIKLKATFVAFKIEIGNLLRSQMKSGNKVHFTGYPCGVENKGGFKSMLLKANSNPENVNCLTCIKVCTRITEQWAEFLKKQKQAEAKKAKKTEADKQPTKKTGRK